MIFVVGMFLTSACQRDTVGVKLTKEMEVGYFDDEVNRLFITKERCKEVGGEVGKCSRNNKPYYDCCRREIEGEGFKTPITD